MFSCYDVVWSNKNPFATGFM